MSRPGSAERRFYQSRQWKEVRALVLERDADGLCRICWEPIGVGGRDRATVDHVVPLKVAPGLGLELSNLRVVHNRCNIARRGRLTVGKHYRSRAW